MEGTLANGALIAIETGIIAGAIGILTLSYHGSAKLLNTAEVRSSQLDQSRRMDEYSQYDGRTVTGADVLLLLKNGEEDGIRVTVKTNAGGTLDTGSHDLDSILEDAKNYGSSRYISPVDNYTCEITYSGKTGEIEEMIFQEN